MNAEARRRAVVFYAAVSLLIVSIGCTIWTAGERAGEDRILTVVCAHAGLDWDRAAKDCTARGGN